MKCFSEIAATEFGELLQLNLDFPEIVATEFRPPPLSVTSSLNESRLFSDSFSDFNK